MINKYIALVRSNPCPNASGALLGALADAGARHASAIAFFHGDGCAMAHRLAGDALRTAVPGQVELRICTTSWARRYESAPPPPLQAASLMFFFQHVALARRIDSFSPGGWFCTRAQDAHATQRRAPRLLLEIGSAATDARQQRETLEVALGAAALELSGGVLFHGPGLGHLAGDGGRGWHQISDFGLLEMFALGTPDRIAANAGAVAVDPARAAQLRAGATTILLV